MRLVDYFIEPLLKVRLLSSSNNLPLDAAGLKQQCQQWLDQACDSARSQGFSSVCCQQALFPLAAYIDEILLTSNWAQAKAWQQDSLQRHYFATTNAGQEFFQRLSELNRQGEDAAVREVYLVCLGLGFKGQHFLPSDRQKLAEVRAFNLDLLLRDNDSQELVNQKASYQELFADAYQAETRSSEMRKGRFNWLPVFTALPFAVVLSVFAYYAVSLNQSLASIIELVK